jgi:hypothetical protein
VDASPPDSPTDSSGNACANDPTQGIPCMGMLGAPFAGSFTCSPTFLFFNTAIGPNTRFSLSMNAIANPIAGVQSIELAPLDIVGGPPTTGGETLLNNPTDRVTVQARDGSGNHSYEAQVAPVIGSLTLDITTITRRMGGTGESCAHGTLMATLADVQDVNNTMMLTVSF